MSVKAVLFKIFLAVIFLNLAFNHSVFSQELSGGEAALKDKAAADFKAQRYDLAMPAYSQLLSNYSKEPEYNYCFGVCLVELNQTLENAIRYLDADVSKKYSVRAYFYLGKAYHLSYKFDDAIRNYELFKAKGSGGDVKELQPDMYLQMCNSGKDLIKYISDLIVIENKRVPSGDFYRSYSIKDFGGEIMVTDEFKEKTDKSSTTKPIVFISSKYNSVFYSSYGKSKSNGKDIYRRKRLPDGSWGEPENLGNVINSPYDEDYPFLHPDGKTLYFCSKGHNSMGGYDIFKSVYNFKTETWSAPVNLDFPTNSPYDDILFTTDLANNVAFFASNRETTGDKISVYKIKVDKKPVKKETLNLQQVKDKSKLEVTPGADTLIAEESTTTLPPTGLGDDVNTEPVDYNTYTFKSLTASQNLTPAKIVEESKNDAAILKMEAKEIKKDADYTYVIAANKNQMANDKMKESDAILATIDKNAPPKDREAKAKQAMQLKEESDKLSKEAVVAFNLAKNLENVSITKEKEAVGVEKFTANLEDKTGQDPKKMVDEVNKNRAGLNLGQKKYTTFESELGTRKEMVAEKSKELSNSLKEIDAATKERETINSEIQKVKQDINDPANASSKPVLQSKLDALATDLNENKAQVEELTSKAQKQKVDVKTINDEVTFLQQMSTESKSDENKRTEIAAKAATIDKSALNKEIFDKEFSADTMLASTITKEQTVKNVDSLKSGSKAVIDQTKANVDKEQEIKNLLAEVKRNEQGVDSMNLQVEQKQKELAKAKTDVEKAKIQNEISELQDLAKIKKQQAEKKNAQAKEAEKALLASSGTTTGVTDTVDLVKNNPAYTFAGNDNTGDKQQQYEKEIFLANNYEQIAESYEKDITVMKSGLDTISDPATKEAVKTRITELENVVTENKSKATESKANSEKIKASAPSGAITDTGISADELLVKASSYTPQNQVKLDDKQSEQIASIPEDRKTADASYGTFKEKSNEAKKLENEAATAAKPKEKAKLLQKAEEIRKTSQNDFLIFNETYALVDSEEFAIYNEVLEDNRKVGKNNNLKLANELEKEANIYFDKATFIRKNAPLITDFNRKSEELEKAKNLESVALSKQKHAADLYIKAQKEGYKESATASSEPDPDKPSNIKEVKASGITLLYEEEEALKNYREKDYQATSMLEESTKILSEVEANKEAAKAIKNEKERTGALKKIAESEAKAKKNIIDAYDTFGDADSLKYTVYKEQLAQLTATLDEIENNTIITKQYEKEADFYYIEARKIRDNTNTMTDTIALIKNLEKATELEKKALSNQEVAVNVLMEVDPVMFAASNDLIKVEVLEKLNKPVNVENVQRMQEQKIIEQLKLTKDDRDAYDLALEKDLSAESMTKESENIQKQVVELQEKISSSKDEKEKKKMTKEIEKLKSKSNDIKIRAYESSELVHNTKYSIYSDYFKNERLNDNSEKSRQGKQLEKDADIHFEKAMQFRERFYNSDDKNIKLLEDANSLELQAIEEQEKAYQIYMNLPSAEEIAAKQQDTSLLATTTTGVSETMLIKTDGGVTPIVTKESEKPGYKKPADETKKPGDETKKPGDETKKPSDETKKPGDVTKKPGDETKKPGDETKKPGDVTKKPGDETKKPGDETKKPGDETKKPGDETKKPGDETKKPGDETKKPGDVTKKPGEGTVKPGESGFVFGFSVLGNSPYSENNPIPVNVKLPDCIIFKVQIGAFVNPIKQDAFKGLYPLTGEQLPNTKFIKYLLGMFRSYDAAKIVLTDVRNMGYADAFIVSYLDGQRVPQFQVMNMIKAGSDDCVTGYNAVAQSEVKMVTQKTTSGADVAATVGKTAGNETKKTIAETVGRNVVNPSDIKSEKGLLYTVQIGICKEYPTSDKLHDLSPIYKEETEFGFTRLTAGIFDNFENARSEKNKIVQIGVEDAFVAAYLDGKRINLDEARKMEKGNNVQMGKTNAVSVSEKADGTVTGNVDVANIIFKVQIGAYKEQVPNNVVNKFLKLAANRGLDQTANEKGVTVYSVGKFKSYDEAVKMKDILINEGIPDAFVIAYDGKKFIPATEARKLLNQ